MSKILDALVNEHWLEYVAEPSTANQDQSLGVILYFHELNAG
ncbi:MAG: hypothetical protein ACREDR_30080 [Blastocatellia bacterium]